MKPNWYLKNKIKYIKKRKNYYEVHTEFHIKPLLIDLEDKEIIKEGKLGYNSYYFTINGISLHRILKEGHIIHHKNKNKMDNRKENLEICNSRKEHFAKHHNIDSSKYQLFLREKDTDELIDIYSKLDEEEIYSILKVVELKRFYK